MSECAFCRRKLPPEARLCPYCGSGNASVGAARGTVLRDASLTPAPPAAAVGLAAAPPGGADHEPSGGAGPAPAPQDAAAHHLRVGARPAPAALRALPLPQLALVAPPEHGLSESPPIPAAGRGPAIPGARTQLPGAPSTGLRAGRIVGWLLSYSQWMPDGHAVTLRIGKCSVGRAADCDLELAYDPSVSSRHALIIARGDTVSIADTNSTAGTWVNGVDIGHNGTCALSSGDVLRFGETTFCLSLVDPTGAQSLWSGFPDFGARHE